MPCDCRKLSEEAAAERTLCITEHMIMFQRENYICDIKSLWLIISWLCAQDRSRNCPALQAIWCCLAEQFREQTPDREAAKAAFRQGITSIRENDESLKYLTNDAIDAINNWDEIYTQELGKVIAN